MTNITPEVAGKNFEQLAKILIRTAVSEKALAFAEKKINEVRARGTQWISDNAITLQVLSPAEGRFCPVEDNRNYYIEQIQVALRAKP